MSKPSKRTTAAGHKAQHIAARSSTLSPEFDDVAPSIFIEDVAGNQRTPESVQPALSSSRGAPSVSVRRGPSNTKGLWHEPRAKNERAEAAVRSIREEKHWQCLYDCPCDIRQFLRRQRLAEAREEFRSKGSLTRKLFRIYSDPNSTARERLRGKVVGDDAVILHELLGLVGHAASPAFAI
jgi:hypothetical protein